MTSKKVLKWYSRTVILLSLATVMVMLISWIASLYGFEVRNLLSLEGIRWLFRRSLRLIDEEFPSMSLLVLSMGLGVTWKSGILRASRLFLTHPHLLSFKERWGIQLASLAACLPLLFLCWGVFNPYGNLLSVTDEWSHSPLLEGCAIWLSLSMMLVCSVYGWLSGRFRHAYQLIACAIWGVQQAAPLFIFIFVLLHFLLICHYVWS